MAHNLAYTATGRAYMGRQAAWHGLGNVTGEFFSWSDICRDGMLDYQVEKRQLEYSGQPIEAWGTFRTDNEQFLGTVGEDYTPIQHSKGFSSIDSLINSIDGAHYETCGALGKGEIVWGLVDLAHANEVVPGDTHESYLLFSTSHDGTVSYNFRLTNTRVVCQNTLTAALNSRAKTSLSVRHTQNAARRIADIDAAIQDIRGQNTSIVNTLRQLAEKKTTRQSVESIFARLYPVKPGEESSTRRNNILSGILSRFESNDNNAFPEIRGTAYNLLNAITEYTDHDRSAQNGKRAESAMFGTGDALKSLAYEVIRAESAYMPSRPTQTYVMTPPAPSESISLLDQILESSN